MFQSVTYVVGETVLFTDRNNLPIPRVGELVEFESKWYKVRQVYYTYKNLSRDDICCFIEVNLEKTEFK